MTTGDHIKCQGSRTLVIVRRMPILRGIGCTAMCAVTCGRTLLRHCCLSGYGSHPRRDSWTRDSRHLDVCLDTGGQVKRGMRLAVVRTHASVCPFAGTYRQDAGACTLLLHWDALLNR